MKKAIVLGGTTPHITLIQKLQERGYYVILVDYLGNPPAKAYADKHVQESTLDKDIVLKVAKEEHVDLVISTCIDQCNSICCYVAEKLNLPHPYSYQTSLDVTDKGLMKSIMRKNGIPTSSYIICDNPTLIDLGNIAYPSVVKPVDCLSSKGVRRVDSKEEAVNAITEALSLSRKGEAIIEGFYDGFEIQVDCVNSVNGVQVVLTRQKQKIAATGNEMVLQHFGSIIPAQLSEDLQEQALEIAKKIAKAFNLGMTPFFYQAIVTTEGIQVIELAPRIGGGLSYYLINDLVGFDVVGAAIDSFLGKDVYFTSKMDNKCYSTNLIYMKEGVFDHISGFEDLKSRGIIYSYFTTKNKGTIVDSDMRSSNRVGAFIIQADNYNELRDKAAESFSKIEVFDSDNNPLLNRSIYPNL